MPKACAFCIHEDREELQAALRSRQKTQQDVADILGVDRSCISRHMRDHISQEPDSLKIDELRKQLTALQDRVDTLEKELREHEKSQAHRRF